MTRHIDHDLLRRAMELWQQHKHPAHTDVTLRQFIGVFHATMEAVRETEATRERDDPTR